MSVSIQRDQLLHGIDPNTLCLQIFFSQGAFFSSILSWDWREILVQALKSQNGSFFINRIHYVFISIQPLSLKSNLKFSDNHKLGLWKIGLITKEHEKLQRGSPQGFNPTCSIKNIGNWEKLGAGEIIFFRDKQTNWLSKCQMVNPKIHLEVTLCELTQQVIFRNMYLYANTYICMNNNDVKKS